MAKPKFLTLMAALEKAELSLFQKHLKETVGKEGITYEVFEYFRRFYPAFDDEKKLDLDYAARKIFTSETQPDDKKRVNLQNALSDLNLALKNFLIRQKAESDDFIRRVLWIRFLKERGFKKECFREVEDLFNDTERKGKSHTDEYLEYLAASFFRFEQLSQETANPNIPHMKHCLTVLKTYGQMVFLKLAWILANVEKVRPDKSPIPQEQDAAQLAQTTGTILLEIYRDIYELIQTEDQAIYDRIEKMLDQHLSNIHSDELTGIYTYLHNFLAHKQRTEKDDEWGQKLHQLHRFALEHGFYDKKDAMPHTLFLNIANVAAALKKIEWAEQFIQNYGPRFEENIILLAQAGVLFEKGDFDAVHTLLFNIDFRHQHDRIRSRVLWLRNYMESRKFDHGIVLSHANALENMLTQNKQRPESMQAILEFVRLSKMIITGKTKPDVLKERINAKTILIVRKWLLKQVDAYR